MEIKYISEGAWTSRMIVSFFLDGKETTKPVSGSGKFVTIPSRAKDIEVKFQVRRPFWGDVMKYNRFRKAWVQPYEPHVFRYDKPTNRTFTISGNLWWEAVMGVTNEYHDETKELWGFCKTFRTLNYRLASSSGQFPKHLCTVSKVTSKFDPDLLSKRWFLWQKKVG